ncbi:MAG: hypothetical protein FWF33_00545 [Clostridiales bacterium]|nr:hypothetical protein [Clostridiales bacterium]
MVKRNGETPGKETDVKANPKKKQNAKANPKKKQNAKAAPKPTEAELRVSPAKEAKLKAERVEAIRGAMIQGKSVTTIYREFGAGAEKVLKEIFDGIKIQDPQCATKIAVERLAYLSEKLMPKAEEGGEVAINAVVKIMQVQQQFILGYAHRKKEAAETGESMIIKLRERDNKEKPKP